MTSTPRARSASYSASAVSRTVSLLPQPTGQITTS
ncbi:Uncharacterised protein [Bordetella pertussis]|nr:Uncharacterised protein [Bordetella pertussis]